MNEQIRDILSRCEGSFLADADAQLLGSYADGVLSRVDTMQAIERAEPAILDDVVDEVMGEHPDMPSKYGADASQRVRRDQAMLLRYATMAMVLHDQGFVRDKLAVWLRTIMLALCRPEQVMLGYKSLERACERHLAPDQANAIVPYIRVMTDEFAPYARRSA